MLPEVLPDPASRCSPTGTCSRARCCPPAGRRTASACCSRRRRRPGPGPRRPRRRNGLRRIALAHRVVELEKPAHTTFDVRFYWDAFRVGEARLGLDTIADLGSRSPDLLVDAVLGASHLGASRLADPTTASAATGGAR